VNPTILGFLKKEFIQALRDVRMRVLIFAAPIIQLTLFGYAISTEVRNIRLAIAHAPGDVIAQRIEQQCLASRWFVPVSTEGEPFTLVQSGRAEVALVAPPGGLTRAVYKGQGEIQVLIDATNMMRARSVEQYLMAVIRKVAEDTFPNRLQGPKLTMDLRLLYNPGLRTAFFLVPGVMVMLVCLLTIILTSMALAKEKEMGTFEALVAAPIRNSEILLGKTLPYIVLGLVVVAIVLFSAMLIFGLPIRGSLWKFILASLVFVCTTVSVGIMISTFARTQQQAMMGSFMFLFPGIMLSGMMFPVENMPKALISVAYLNPLKYYLTLLRNILLKGGDDWVFWSNLGALAVLAFIAMFLSFNRFRQTLN
jgi:ABC-2 type transport system permease protein